MAYVITVKGVTIEWVGDGCGQMTVPGAQSLTVGTQGFPGAQTQSPSLLVVVPGGDSPTAANITTACTTLGTNLGSILSTSPNVGIIQGWSTGGQ